MPKFFADYCEVKRNPALQFQWSYQSPWIVSGLDFSRNRTHTGFEYWLHSVGRFSLFLPEQGAYCCRLNGELLRVEPGSLLLVTPYQFHQDVLDAGIRFQCFQFTLQNASTGEEVSQFFKAETPPKDQILPLTPQMKECLAVLRGLIDAFRLPASPRFIYAQFLAFLECVVSSVPSSCLAQLRPPEKPIEWFTARMTSLFEQNLGTFLSLADLCQAMGMGRSALYQKSMQGFCRGPVRAFLHFKMERARQMMRSSSLSLKQISMQLGFASQMQFSRAYRKIYHETPSETLHRFALQ